MWKWKRSGIEYNEPQTKKHLRNTTSRLVRGPDGEIRDSKLHDFFSLLNMSRCPSPKPQHKRCSHISNYTAQLLGGTYRQDKECGYRDAAYLRPSSPNLTQHPGTFRFPVSRSTTSTLIPPLQRRDWLAGETEPANKASLRSRCSSSPIHRRSYLPASHKAEAFSLQSGFRLCMKLDSPTIVPDIVGLI